jgi:hypothetical protein
MRALPRCRTGTVGQNGVEGRSAGDKIRIHCTGCGGKIREYWDLIAMSMHKEPQLQMGSVHVDTVDRDVALDVLPRQQGPWGGRLVPKPIVLEIELGAG